MKKTPPQTVRHIGIDVSKAHLDFDLAGTPKRIPNQSQDIRLLLEELRSTYPGAILCMEATGAYTRLLILEALKLEIPVALLNARQVRNDARAAGFLAKTDSLDAKIITRHCDTFPPKTIDSSWVARDQLQQHHQWLDSLIAEAARVKTSLEYYSDPALRTRIKRHLGALQKRIETCKRDLDKLLSKQAGLSAKRTLVEQVTGVGPATSRTLIITMPELGKLKRNQAAALAGLAPMNRDSGAARGRRTIQGGRAKARKALYMAALTAAYRNPMFMPLYQRHRDNGKPVKVALTAVARKLLIHLNTLLKNHPNSGHLKT